MDTENRIRTWARIAFLYFILAALLGCFLRYMLVRPVGNVNYNYMLHTHSHIAFLGWIFNALYAAILYAFIPARDALKKEYLILYIAFQVSVIGMLVTFPIGGYYRDSIIVSTLHVVLSVVFAWMVFKAKKKDEVKNKLPYLFIVVSLIFMIVSSLGPFALGPIMAMDLAQTDWYHLAIYFYLHFQYNGWFIFALLGLFFALVEKEGIPYNTRLTRSFFWLMTLSCAPAYALSALWADPPAWVFVTGWIAALMQLAAVVALALILKPLYPKLRAKFNRISLILYSLVGLSFLAKHILQFISVFDWAIELAYMTRNFVIAYMHLVFLGVCSLFLVGYFHQQGWLRLHTRRQQSGLWLFVIAFFLSELILVVNPMMAMRYGVIIPAYNWIIFIISVAMALGLILIFPGFKNKKGKNT